MANSIAPFRLRAYHWLAAVPPLGMLGGVPFANRVHTLVLGLPFLLSWIVAWVVLTAACMTLLYALDHRATPDEQPRA
ncbi:MAG: DUF3311 domain-containing protein [Gemmatimonadaceae bacterium]